MKRGLVKYRDDKKIINGTTTIVYGTTEAKPSGILGHDLNQVLNLSVKLFGNSYETRGVAKLAEGDVYDEVSGIIVASKKAEKAGNKMMRKDVEKLIQALELYVIDLKEEVDALKHREEVLESDKH